MSQNSVRRHAGAVGQTATGLPDGSGVPADGIPTHRRCLPSARAVVETARALLPRPVREYKSVPSPHMSHSMSNMRPAGFDAPLDKLGACSGLPFGASKGEL